MANNTKRWYESGMPDRLKNIPASDRRAKKDKVNTKMDYTTKRGTIADHNYKRRPELKFRKVRNDEMGGD